MIHVPDKFEGIIKTFGNIENYINSDGSIDLKWESEFIELVQLPFNIPLAGNHLLSVKRIKCHKNMKDIFLSVFNKILQEGLEKEVTSYGGCYLFRAKRNSSKFSTHSWGIALDLNTETNQLGTSGNMNENIISIFKSFGFIWGGDWKGKSQDPMHFQFCTNY